ncbi:MAG: type 4a pilus biogenesis protein PilO [Candidatus Omnitrophota bacterium]|nr:type 4a pilus biogenesis protein PilO [Candidatus Omnitrophota bacterium]
MPMPSNISKSDLEKIVLIGIAAFVVLFILIRFAMVPSFRKLGSLKKEIVKEQEALKSNQALIASKSQLQARLASIQGRLQGYEKALPPYREMPNILQKIAEVAYENKMKITKIEPLRTEKPAETAKAKVIAPAKPGAKPEASKKPAMIYTEIPIQIEAKGGYHALGGFINMIETSDNIMSVRDIDIEANPDDNQNHKVKLLIVAYVLREETPAK